MSGNTLLAALALAAAGLLTARLDAAQITAERSPQGALVKIDGQLFTEYLVRSGNKPILWPILGPTGKAMTRAYPMEVVAREHHDHPHQRSLWFTHGAVNGVNFWGEKPSTPGDKIGTTAHREFVTLRSGPQAVIVARNDWLGPDGKKVCEDQRTLVFGSGDDVRWIDFAIVLRASNGPLLFGDTKEGGFGLRVAETIAVDAKQGGRLVNSRGQTNRAAWGKPAEWIDCHGPVEGQVLGIAILNHPSSFHFPTGWHARTYGLVGANPFAMQAFQEREEPTCGYALAAGKTLQFRYRVLFHRGDQQQAKVDEAFAAYAKQ